MDFLYLTIEEESRRTQSALWVILGKTFVKESAQTAINPKKPVALSVASISIDQEPVENASVEDTDNNSTYKIRSNTNKVSSCEQVESNASSSMSDYADRIDKSSDVIFREKVKINAPSSMIDDTQGSKSSKVSSREKVQTSFMVYNAEERISSKDLNNINKETASEGSKGSDETVSDAKSDLHNLDTIIINL